MKADDIIDLVCQITETPKEVLESKRRDSNIPVVRHLCFFFMKEHTLLSLQAIAEKLNRVDHSTVLYAIGKVEDRNFTSKTHKYFFDKIKSELPILD